MCLRDVSNKNQKKMSVAVTGCQEPSYCEGTVQTTINEFIATVTHLQGTYFFVFYCCQN